MGLNTAETGVNEFPGASGCHVVARGGVSERAREAQREISAGYGRTDHGQGRKARWSENGGE